MISIPSAVRPNRTEPTDAVLLHDDAAPSARQIIGHMLAHAATADFAIARIRLATVDLSEAEAEGRATCRVLLGRLDAETLGAGLIADADRPTRGAQILALKRLIESGRLQVRSAGTHRWSPDFSVARGLAARPTMPAGELCMVGAHFFARPFAAPGPTLTALLTHPDAIAAATTRFDALWSAAYDVLPVVADTIAALLPAAG
jgi:hypothetical protein